jgi:hypothetical protein
MQSFPLTVKTVTLTAKDYRTACQVDDNLLRFRHTCERNEMMNEIDRKMTYELRRAVYGIDHPSKHFISYPATWYDAFKLRFFPKFLREKYPIQYCRVTVSLSETYPDFKHALQDHNPIIQLLVTETYPND